MEDRKRKEKVGKGKFCYWITYDQTTNIMHFLHRKTQKIKNKEVLALYIVIIFCPCDENKHLQL